MDRASENLLAGVDGELARRVRAMEAALAPRGIGLKVTSGRRSTAQQAVLYANRASNPNPVAKPGTSKHEQGLAVDVVPTGARSAAVQKMIGEEGERQGLRWGGRFSKPDPVHFELAADSNAASSTFALMTNDAAQITTNGAQHLTQAKKEASGGQALVTICVCLFVWKFVLS